MSKMVKIMKNKLMIAAMVAVMVFGTAMVPVHAAAVETNYYLYILYSKIGKFRRIGVYAYNKDKVGNKKYIYSVKSM